MAVVTISGNASGGGPARAAVGVEVWSDIACPFCYIGKRKFEAGVRASGVPVSVRYRSFELTPDAPDDRPGGNRARLTEKFGISEAEAREMERRNAQAARAVGLDFDYARLQPARTLAAHQLLHLAQERGRQEEMAERLLRAHFTEGRHVGRVAELADLAVDVGLDRAEVVRSLEAGEYRAHVQADIDQAQAFGIRGVPFYVIDGKYGVSGAQDPAVFAQALTQAHDERTTTP